MPRRLVLREIEAGHLAEVPLPIDLPLNDIGMLLPTRELDPALQKLSAFLCKFAASGK
jgi:DNA-binding transcriptional LysR family regulator